MANNFTPIVVSYFLGRFGACDDDDDAACMHLYMYIVVFNLKAIKL